MFASNVQRERLEERLDPAFYAPLPLKADEWLRRLPTDSRQRLDDLVDPKTSAFYEGIAGRYRKEGVPLVRVADVRLGTLDLRDAVRLSETVATGTLGLTAVTSPIILITKGGSVGRVGVATDLPLLALSRDVIGLVPKNAEVTGLVLFYLASVPGRAQVLRGASRQVQAHLTLGKLTETLVPKLFNGQLRLLQEAMDHLMAARRSFDDARLSVDSQWAEIDPFARLDETNVGYSLQRSADLRNRLDPGYYQPGFAAAAKEAESRGWARVGLSSWISLAEDRWHRFAGQPDKHINYIPLSAVEALSCRITKPMHIRTWQAPTRAKWLVQKNDVIVPYLLGSMDRVGVVDESHDGAVCSSGFHVLRTDAEEQSKFVAAYLSSAGAKRQITRAGTGAVMKSVSVKLLEDVFLPPRDLEKVISPLMTRVQTEAARLEASWRAGLELVHNLIGWEGTEPILDTVDAEDEE